MDIDKIIAEVERLDRCATKDWRQEGCKIKCGPNGSMLTKDAHGYPMFIAYDDASAAVYCRNAAPLLAAEVQRLRAGGCARDQRTTQFCAEAVAKDAEIAKLRAELVECRQARDTLQAFLSSTSESLDKARAELRAKYSPDAMDLVGQRLVNARKSLDPDAPIWLTAAMDEAWGVLAFLRRNSAQQAARIEQQDDELAKLRDQILGYQQELHIAEQEIARLKRTMIEPTEQTGDEDSEQ